MTPAIQVPADTSAIPRLLGNLKHHHTRMTRVFVLLRAADGPIETTQAMQALLLEIGRSRQSLARVAAHYNLPLEELVASKINCNTASVADMERFVHPVVDSEGEPA